MPKIIIAGNWKMNKTLSESVELARSVKTKAATGAKNVELVICPVFPHLVPVAEVLSGSPVKLGAQNCYPADNGAYTGEVSGHMLSVIGTRYVILGHSERRQYFAETDTFINEKIKHVMKHGMTAIYCVGETLAQREANETNQVVTTQIRAGLSGLAASDASQLVIAYEPVWAIGTGKVATPDQANDVHVMIRELLNDQFGPNGADISILYGGSMKPDNAAELLSQSEINGGLIGGASLKAEDFLAIANAVS